LFFLDDFKKGTLDLLGSLYPGGMLKAYTDPGGKTYLYSYRIPHENLRRSRNWSGVQRGLWGSYRHTSNPLEMPFLERWDPIINFTYRDLPNAISPLFITWSGKLRVSQEGEYEFLLMTFEPSRARLSIDGKIVADVMSMPLGKI